MQRKRFWAETSPCSGMATSYSILAGCALSPSGVSKCPMNGTVVCPFYFVLVELQIPGSALRKLLYRSYYN